MEAQQFFAVSSFSSFSGKGQKIVATLHSKMIKACCITGIQFELSHQVVANGLRNMG